MNTLYEVFDAVYDTNCNPNLKLSEISKETFIDYALTMGNGICDSDADKIMSCINDYLSANKTNDQVDDSGDLWQYIEEPLSAIET